PRRSSDLASVRWKPEHAGNIGNAMGSASSCLICPSILDSPRSSHFNNCGKHLFLSPARAENAARVRNMHFGIDVGTTRTIAAVVDRGNYPVVTVEDYLGDAQEYIPSVVALDGDRLVAGWEAMKLGPDDPSLVRSFKRIMSDHSVTAGTPVQLGHATRPLGEVLRVYAETVVDTLRNFQATLGDSSPIEVVLGIPA